MGRDYFYDLIVFTAAVKPSFKWEDIPFTILSCNFFAYKLVTEYMDI